MYRVIDLLAHDLLLLARALVHAPPEPPDALLDVPAQLWEYDGQELRGDLVGRRRCRRRRRSLGLVTFQQRTDLGNLLVLLLAEVRLLLARFQELDKLLREYRGHNTNGDIHTSAMVICSFALSAASSW